MAREGAVRGACFQRPIYCVGMEDSVSSGGGGVTSHHWAAIGSGEVVSPKPSRTCDLVHPLPRVLGG